MRTCISVWRRLAGSKRPLDTLKRILDPFGGDLATNCSPPPSARLSNNKFPTSAIFIRPLTELDA